jgi:hypothetical protein
MSKTVIAPIVALIALIAGGVFHISIDDDTQQTIVEGIVLLITAATTLYGIIKNHNKTPGA